MNHQGEAKYKYNFVFILHIISDKRQKSVLLIKVHLFLRSMFCSNLILLWLYPVLKKKKKKTMWITYLWQIIKRTNLLWLFRASSRQLTAFIIWVFTFNDPNFLVYTSADTTILVEILWLQDKFLTAIMLCSFHESKLLVTTRGFELWTFSILRRYLTH